MFQVFHFKRLNSTNEKAKEIAKENIVIIADEQTKGKGRFKRYWSSKRGGIYLSITVKISTEDIKYLTFIAAISACKAIETTLNLKTKIKWPNDLIYKNKKVCGILTETTNNKKTLAIVGIGMNTNNSLPSSIKKATSIKDIIKKKVNNKEIIKKLLEYFSEYIKLLKNKKYHKIIKDWKENSFLGSKVKVKTIKKEYQGIAHDIDKDCFLIIKNKKDKIVIREGDITILNKQ